MTPRPRNRIWMKYGRRLLNEWGGLMTRLAPHGDAPVFDPAEFPWTRALEANWQAIRAELDPLLAERARIPDFQQISPDQAHLAPRDRWKTFFLYGFGYRADRNCERCPETTRLIEQVPGMKTAFFSILSPGTHVPAHRGPYKGILRYHLGVLIPDEQACRIRVDSTLLHWREGESLVFDDTYEHEVWNDSDADRVVLFLDVLRPLPRPLELLNRALVQIIAWSPFVQDGRRNMDRLGNA